MNIHITGDSLLIIFTFVAVEDPKIRGLAAASTLTMNQELEGHKGIIDLFLSSLQFFFSFHRKLIL